jgi:hypothetical protein
MLFLDVITHVMDIQLNLIILVMLRCCLVVAEQLVDLM